MRVTIDLQGLPNLRAHLAKLQDPAKMDEVLHMAALEVERRATARAPVNKQVGIGGGTLKGSIRTVRLGMASYAVVSHVAYAAFVEFGTGLRGRGSPQPLGVPGEYVHGPKPGMPSQPFLRPSLMEVEEALRRPAAWKGLL